MGLKDSIVRSIGLRLLKGKVNGVRTGKESGMKQALKFLDGWKLVLGVIALFGVGVYDAKTGGHASDIVTAVLQTLGWLPAGGEWNADAIAKASSSAVVLLGLGGKLWKAQAQIRAGSSVAGALSAEGFAVKHEVDLAKGKPAAVAVEVKAIEAAAEAPKG